MEIDKCKQELQDIKGKMFTQEYMYVQHPPGLHPNCIANIYMTLSSLPVSPRRLDLLITPSLYRTSRRSVGPRPGQKRDVPHYPKYVLSKETVAYLKKPTFDIWHWEPNEMLCLMEHMYHQLGLVTALNINPITLKRWLVRV